MTQLENVQHTGKARRERRQVVTREGFRPATAEQRLKELGIKLPTPPEPFGTYVEVARTARLFPWFDRHSQPHPGLLLRGGFDAPPPWLKREHRWGIRSITTDFRLCGSERYSSSNQ